MPSPIPEPRDADERYVYEERLAILIQGTRPATPDESALATADVLRYRLAIASPEQQSLELK